MHYIFNPVYAGSDSFGQEIVNEASEGDFDTFSRQLDEVKYRLMELPFNEKTYRLIGDLNFHQALYTKDVMSGFDCGDLLLTRVSDSISIVSLGFDDATNADKIGVTIKMITKKKGVIWPSHIPDDINSLKLIKEALVESGLANVEDVDSLLKD